MGYACDFKNKIKRWAGTRSCQGVSRRLPEEWAQEAQPCLEVLVKVLENRVAVSKFRRAAPWKGQYGAVVNRVSVEVRMLGFKSPLHHLQVRDLEQVT